MNIKFMQQVGVQFYVCLPFIFLMRGIFGRDFEGYHILYGKGLVAYN
jgi:hypothetical protein